MTVLKQYRGKYGVLPAHVFAAVERIIQNDKRTLVGGAGAAITDSSTGTDNSIIGLVPTQDVVFVSAGADIALKTSFDTAIGTVNNALAVLGDSLSDLLDPALLEGAASPYITQGDGTIALADTIAAMTKTVTGDAGATAIVVGRTAGNLAVSVMRNNFQTINKAYNDLAVATGAAKIIANAGGAHATDFVLANNQDSGTAVDNTADVFSKASADAALLAMADNVAHLAAQRNALRTAASTQLLLNMVD